MKCPNCGNENADGAVFCITCGSGMSTDQPQRQYSNFNSNMSSNYNTVNNETASVDSTPLNYLMYCVAAILKPFKTFKEEENKLSNPKTSLIFAGIVSAIMMLVTLLKSMINVIFTKEFDMSTFEYKSVVKFSNLKNLKYLNLIGKNLIIYIGIIVAVAGVYYLVGLIFKKNANFFKTLSMSATSFLPYIILGMILSPILAKIWIPLAVVASIVGFVYSTLIYLNLINNDLGFATIDLKIYFNLICISILGVSGYYLLTKLLISSISSSLDTALKMLN